ncbi:MAG: tetratricopeptide repeat protein [Anaerococcus sp.]|nr:tetratricopeptide repeat protein [Anaerococcus sp.]
MKLDKYFRKFIDKIAYINLKETASYKLLDEIPLPIYMKDMSQGIASGEFKEKIDIKIILDGMLINIGADEDFIHNYKYINILNHYLEDITAFGVRDGLTYIDEDKDKALLLFRGGYKINPSDNFNAYNYARFLWPKAYEDDIKEKDDFVREALRILQEIIGRDENFAIAYYELGNIYKNLGEYLKARNYYNNALRKTEPVEAKEEVRDRLREINDNAEIEEALYYIGKSDYNKAIMKLTGILSIRKRPDAYYYLAVAYQNLGQYENSIMAFENALNEGADFREVYNDYAISLYLNENPEKALEIIKKGLSKYPEDPRLSYNKIQVEIKLGRLSVAKEDIEKLLSYDDLTEEIKENLQIIKGQFNL